VGSVTNLFKTFEIFWQRNIYCWVLDLVENDTKWSWSTVRLVKSKWFNTRTKCGLVSTK